MRTHAYLWCVHDFDFFLCQVILRNHVLGWRLRLYLHFAGEIWKRIIFMVTWIRLQNGAFQKRLSNPRKTTFAWTENILRTDGAFLKRWNHDTPETQPKWPVVVAFSNSSAQRRWSRPHNQDSKSSQAVSGGGKYEFRENLNWETKQTFIFSQSPFALTLLISKF